MSYGPKAVHNMGQELMTGEADGGSTEVLWLASTSWQLPW